MPVVGVIATETDGVAMFLRMPTEHDGHHYIVANNCIKVLQLYVYWDSQWGKLLQKNERKKKREIHGSSPIQKHPTFSHPEETVQGSNPLPAEFQTQVKLCMYVVEQEPRRNGIAPSQDQNGE
jgi:hypothetical protein